MRVSLVEKSEQFKATVATGITVASEFPRVPSKRDRDRARIRNIEASP